MSIEKKFYKRKKKRFDLQSFRKDDFFLFLKEDKQVKDHGWQAQDDTGSLFVYLF